MPASYSTPAATASLGKARSFPLPDSFFPAISLSAAETQQFENEVERIVQDALVEYNVHESLGPLAKPSPEWTSIGRIGDLTTMRKKTSDKCLTRMFGSIGTDYRHFMDFFYAETACELFEWNQYMYGHAVDATVLRNIHTLSSGKRCLYLGIKWVCLQPSPLARKRDECFLEYMIYTKDLRDRDVGVRVTLPLEISQCPPLPKDMKVKRLKTHSVVIVRPVEAKQATSQLFLMCQSNLDDHTGSSKFNKQLMTILRDMSMFSDSKRLSTHGLATRKNWVPSRSRKSCGICARRFHPGRRRTHCRLCGDVFCKKCTVLRDAPDKKSSSRTFHTVKTKFCKMCVTKTRESDVSVLTAIPTVTSSATTTTTEVNTSSTVEGESEVNSDGVVEETRVSWWSETETGNWQEQSFRFSVSSSNVDCGRKSVTISSDRLTSSTATTRVTLTMQMGSRRSSMGSELSVSDFGSLLDVVGGPSSCRDSLPEHATVEDDGVGKRSFSFEIVDSLLDYNRWPTDDELQKPRRSRMASTPVKPIYLTNNKPAVRGNSRRTASVGSRRTKSRTLSACLAEQEELLRRMVLAASSNGFNPAKTMPVRRTTSPRNNEVYEL